MFPSPAAGSASHQQESCEHEQSHEQQRAREHDLPRLFCVFVPRFALHVFVCVSRRGVSQQDAEHARAVRDAERRAFVVGAVALRHGRAPSRRSIWHVSQRFLFARIHFVLSTAVQRHELSSSFRVSFVVLPSFPSHRIASHAHLFFEHVCFAYGTRTCVGPRLHPSIQARPAVEVSARRDHGMLRHVQADVAFESAKVVRFLVPPLSLLLMRRMRGDVVRHAAVCVR